MPTLYEIGPLLPGLARAVLVSYLGRGHMPAQSSRCGIVAPVFVTLHDGASRLRGCIGTLEPQHPDVFDETGYNAVSAATRDPRFSPVVFEELSELRIDVTVLFPLEWVANSAKLDPQKYGVVVRGAGGRKGVLLPDLSGVDDVATQLRIARQKGNIGEHEAVDLFRFLAERFTESMG